VKLYRINSAPTYGQYGDRLHSLDAGSLVHVVNDDLTPDVDGDVRVYRQGDAPGSYLYVNARHVTPADAADPMLDRVAALTKAVEILGSATDADALIKLADYLQGGAA
jgi:hypothetical protein